MSIDVTQLLPAASEALDSVTAAVRGSSAGSDPAILERIGRLDTWLAAATAASLRGQADEAGLLASQILRDVIRDFPAISATLPSLLDEDRLRRRLAREALGSSQ